MKLDIPVIVTNALGVFAAGVLLRLGWACGDWILGKL